MKQIKTIGRKLDISNKGIRSGHRISKTLVETTK